MFPETAVRNLADRMVWKRRQWIREPAIASGPVRPVLLCAQTYVACASKHEFVDTDAELRGQVIEAESRGARSRSCWS